MFGVQINYKNGEKDWIDPVFNEPVIKEGLLIVENALYSYEYEMENIESWDKYDLCNKCEYDVRSYDCTDDECLNPRY